jgi:hypothetical protein
MPSRASSRAIDRLTPDCDMFSTSPAAANVPLSTIADSTLIPFVTRSSKLAIHADLSFVG